MDFLDDEGRNKMIREAMKVDSMKRVMTALNAPSINPKTTAKTSAMFEKRRQEIEKKREDEESKIKDDKERIEKQNRVSR